MNDQTEYEIDAAIAQFGWHEPRVILSVELAGFPPLPNVSRNRWDKAADNRKWRWDAYLVALQALRETENPEDFPLTRAVVELVVIRPDRLDSMNRPDDDNAIAAIKPCLDGLTDAKVWLDDRVIRGGIRVRHETGPKSLRIEVVMGSAS